jgi:hypothetical protein
MNNRIYKNLQLVRAGAIFAGMLALQLRAHVNEGVGLAVSPLILFSGVIGSWFNDE